MKIYIAGKITGESRASVAEQQDICLLIRLFYPITKMLTMRITCTSALP